MSGLYKGFIATNGKEPVEKYKGLNSFRCYADATKLQSFAGVLRDDCIMIDVDDADSAEKMMQIVEDHQIRCRVTCTSRGKHFTFRNSGVEKCGTKLKLACGITADIKTGGMPEVLKVDGEERFCEWGEVNPEMGEYDELPLWMHPVNTTMDFTTTDSRNSDFYGYILVLQTQLAMTNDQCRATIQIINDYILPEPLDQSELDVILRDEAFEKPIFFEGRKFLHDAFANWMINQHHIKRINGQLHVYKDEFDLDSAYIEYVDPRMVAIMKELVDEYNANPTPENYLKVLYSNPVGFRLTARMTTNYRQLKTIYQWW